LSKSGTEREVDVAAWSKASPYAAAGSATDVKRLSSTESVLTDSAWASKLG
jgi:hypothetical protein